MQHSFHQKASRPAYEAPCKENTEFMNYMNLFGFNKSDKSKKGHSLD